MCYVDNISRKLDDEYRWTVFISFVKVLDFQFNFEFSTRNWLGGKKRNKKIDFQLKLC